jgi:hypothetical protein
MSNGKTRKERIEKAIAVAVWSAVSLYAWIAFFTSI